MQLCFVYLNLYLTRLLVEIILGMGAYTSIYTLSSKIRLIFALMLQSKVMLF